MSFIPPCRRPENDPEDWFIERDGRQYADDEVVPEAQREAIRSALEDLHDREPTAEEMDAAVDMAEEVIVKDALTRRRHARDKCHVDCYLRTQCLGIALGTDANYGTWGGYYPEQLKQIRDLRDKRAARRSAAETEGAEG